MSVDEMGKKQESKKKETEKEEKYMLENGGKVLEELISTGNGKCNPIRNFSAKQLLEATNNFHSPCFTADGKWFKASLNNRPVLIKTSRDNNNNNNIYTIKEAYRDIAISSQMSNHNRVLKLLGCCLGLPVPALVYEDAENDTLNVYGGLGPDYGDGSSLPWNVRLRIAKDIANALTYLHTAFSRPIIHRNVKPASVLLDKDFVPKLSCFSFSISIPEGEMHVRDIVLGTMGYIDPDYYATGCITEKSDVYSFGVFLLVLLTGKPALDLESSCLTEFVEGKAWNEIVDPKILEEEGVIDEEQQKLQAFLNLALRCVRRKSEDRPVMIDVAKELIQIQRSPITS